MRSAQETSGAVRLGGAMEQSLTRRGFMGIAAGVAVGAAGLRLPTVSSAPPLFYEPWRLYSRRGALELTLVAEAREVFVAGAWRRGVVYNGSFTGPTWVVDPGDRIRVRLSNRLEHPTNLHTHGFHVSPNGNSDNALLHIHPGETFDFEYALPRNHAPGLNWYHPHEHSHGTEQIFGGMTGAIIVRSAAERRRRRPRVRDRVLVLQAPEWDANGQLKTWSAGLLASQLRLVNGQLNPRIPVREGETEHWRILNATVSDFFDLRLDGHRFVQVNADGNPLERAVETEVVHLPPGGRAEVLVRGGPRGSYALRALPFDHGAGFIAPEMTLATVATRRGASGSPVDPEDFLQPFCDLRELPLANRRRITFTMRGGFLIDGKPFDPQRTDQIVKLNTVEEWEIVNDSPLVHPFHIHINPFQITHRNGTPVDEGSYRDTVSIPPLGGSVTLRTLFADFPGRSVYHCHIVPHSDLGMMAVFEVRADNDAPAPPPLVCPV